MADFNQLTGPLLQHLMTIYTINRHTNVADVNQKMDPLHPHLMNIYTINTHKCGGSKSLKWTPTPSSNVDLYYKQVKWIYTPKYINKKSCSISHVDMMLFTTS